MGKRFDYEYIVIGAGAAGITAAKQLAEAGRKVALIEQDKWGGRHWRDLKENKAIPTQKDLEELGVTYIHGHAEFVGNYDVSVTGREDPISAAKFLITTGTEPAKKKIAGIENVKYYTSDSIKDIQHPPKTALVIGGGASGCEAAEYLAKLGTRVVIVECSARLLPKEDEEVGLIMQQYFEKRLGIKTFTNTRAVALEKDKLSSRVVFMRNGEERTVRVENIILAAGRQPSLGVGLKNGGVSYDKKGIVVDKTLQTSARNVFAAGDILGGDSSSERAVYTAEIAVMNMLERTKTYVNYDGFIRVTDTDPQVASVGLSEDDLAKQAKKYKKAAVPLSAVIASVKHRKRIGFLKIMTDGQGKVLGATMVGPNAADVLQELALAIRHQIPLIQVASTPHSASAWTNLVKIAARKLLTSKR